MVQGRGRGRPRNQRPRRFIRPKSYRVVCPGCGKEVVLQVAPLDDKRLLCVDCFRKQT